MNQPTEPRSRLPDWAVAVILTESAALLIALATAFVPGRNGSTWSPADLVADEPGALLRVAASFLLVNLMVAAFGSAVWVATRRNHR